MLARNEHLLVGRVRSIVRTWTTTFTLDQVYALADAEAHKFPLHHTVEARHGVVRRMLQDERPHAGLIFVRDGLYKYPQPAKDCGDPLDDDSTHHQKEKAMLAKTPLATIPPSIADIVAFNEELQYAQDALAKKYGLKLAPMKIEWAHPSQLFIDRNVLVNPRMPEERDSHLKKIAAEFEWNKFNVVKVAPRGDHRGALIDGGGRHRIVTVHLPELADYLLPCHTLDSSARTYSKQAEVFTSQSRVKRLENRDYYIGELIRKDPEAVGIRDTLNEIGFVSPQDKHPKPIPKWPNGFDNIAVARAIYREGDLARTLLIARASWQDEPPSQGLTALGAILKTYPRIDEDRLRKVLRENNPKEMLENIKLERGKMHPYAKAIALAHKYVDAYDHEYRGTLIGGERVARGRRNDYVAGPRSELNSAVNTLVSTWKLAQHTKAKKTESEPKG